MDTGISIVGRSEEAVYRLVLRGDDLGLVDSVPCLAWVVNHELGLGVRSLGAARAGQHDVVVRLLGRLLQVECVLLGLHVTGLVVGF